ncbi:methionine adenosyltransferase [Archaeoglobus sulfaticallidus PM70-1]|uniref:S-adenosylmethionine synthase n=1 Tax=Archaeoglobus sulfaticallidus PM70-1 TaxID=387631 RepID=N0BIE8_9EURY|nr:methionine adenosyltransferase [Archaeoglobus sulfaticallidus]AGK60241.1 methionine adenosyltransferase [Archaeoglobus sulfaticallidus PM70-1]
MKNIFIEEIVHTPIEEQQIEIVERKGIGHPDSLADGIAEAMSRALSKEYLKRCGYVLHHNTDETQIVAGRSNPQFGGGEIIEPIYVLLVGRATKQFDGVYIPADRIVLKAAKEYVKNSMQNLNPETDIVFDVRIGEGSTDLKDVFQRSKGVPHSNDTSFGIGFAPLSETERVVYNVERRIYNEFRKKNPAIGEDVKVMGLREKDMINLTIACAFVDRYVGDIREYIAIKEELQQFVEDIITEYTERKVVVNINTADDYDNKVVYLTVTGTSAENGDDGSVGRGNRANGLITPSRPMSMEATSGKNPINHVGKIYNLLANRIANDCVSAVEGIKEIYVKILSQIGKPIDDPYALSIQVIPEKGYSLDKMESRIRFVAEEWLSDITKITEMVINGELSTF